MKSSTISHSGRKSSGRGPLSPHVNTSAGAGWVSEPWKPWNVRARPSASGSPPVCRTAAAPVEATGAPASCGQPVADHPLLHHPILAVEAVGDRAAADIANLPVLDEGV